MDMCYNHGTVTEEIFRIYKEVTAMTANEYLAPACGTGDPKPAPACASSDPAPACGAADPAPACGTQDK